MVSRQSKYASSSLTSGNASCTTRMPTVRRAQRVITTSVVRSFLIFFESSTTSYLTPVRLEPTLIELEREREDLLIISHASVIRCMLAYLIGLPASEIPAIEVARGDLIEVVPTSYGVHSQAFHFWDGPGRSDGSPGKDEANFYENYAEDTKGKRRPDAQGIITPVEVAV